MSPIIRIPRSNLRNKIAPVTLIVLILLGGISPAPADNVIVLDDDWGGSIERILGQTETNLSLTSGLGKPEREVRFGYFIRRPYTRITPQSKVDWKSSGYEIDLLLPFITFSQDLLLAFNIKNTVASGTATSDRFSSSLFASEDQAENIVRVAHNWKQYRVRWGIEFRWIHYGLNTQLEPSWQVTWGEEQGTRFTLLLSRRTFQTAWNWTLRDDMVAGILQGEVETAQFELGFGDPFGTYFRVVAEDNYMNGFDDGQRRTYTLTPNGLRRKIGIHLEHTPLNKLGWRIGGYHSERQGTVQLTFEDSLLADAPILDLTHDSWGTSLRGRINDNFSWLGGATYYRLRGQMLGDVQGAGLPEEFAHALGGDRVFNSVSAIRGVYGKLQSTYRTRAIQAVAKLGYADMIVDASIADRDLNPEGSPEIRRTFLPVESAGLGWGSLQAEGTYRGWTLGGGASQIFVVSQGLRDKVEETSALSDGWLIKVWLEHRF